MQDHPKNANDGLFVANVEFPPDEDKEKIFIVVEATKEHQAAFEMNSSYAFSYGNLTKVLFQQIPTFVLLTPERILYVVRNVWYNYLLLSDQKFWRGGRVADGGGLENR